MAKQRTIFQDLKPIGDDGPPVVKRTRNMKKGRVVRRSLCMKNVADAVGELEPGCEIFGLTKGRWSLVDLIEHCLEFTGPADCVVSTWTAANADLDFALGFLADERLKSLRFIVDYSFPARQPAYMAALGEAFGRDAFRVTKNHAKFVLMQNEGWDLAIRTSMNLNENKRSESFEVSDCAALSGYLREYVDQLWSEQAADDAYNRTPGEHKRAFETQWGDDGRGLDGEDTSSRKFFGDGPTSVDLRRVGLNRRS